MMIQKDDLMKKIAVLLLVLCSFGSYAQKKMLTKPVPILLDKNYDECEFSGLAEWGDHIILVAQNSKDDRGKPPKFEGNLFYAKKKDISDARDNGNTLPLRLLKIGDFNLLSQESGFKGIEAAVVVGDVIYLSVETENGLNECYVVKGEFVKGRDTSIKLEKADGKLVKQLLKRQPENGKNKDNIGYESLAWIPKQKELLAIFELNYLKGVLAQGYNLSPDLKSGPTAVDFDKRHFRITDAFIKSDTLYALNFWYRNEKALVYDELPKGYRIEDKMKFDFCQILSAVYDGKKYVWDTVGQLPDDANYNWEGLCPFDEGFLLVSDDNKGKCNNALVYVSANSSNKGAQNTAKPTTKRIRIDSWRNVSSIPGKMKISWKQNPAALVLEQDTRVIETAVISAQSNDTCLQNKYLKHWTKAYTLLKNGVTEITEETQLKNIDWAFLIKNGNTVTMQPADSAMLFERSFQGTTAESFGNTNPKDKTIKIPARDTTIYKRYQLRNVQAQNYFDQDKAFLCFGASYMAGISYRNMYPFATQLREQQIVIDRQQERSRFGQAFTAFIGVSVSKMKTVSLEYLNIRQGFQTDSLQHNWQSGMDTFSNTGHDYHLTSHGLGLVLQHSGYGNRFNFAGELGIYSIWTASYADNDLKLKKNTEIGNTGLRLQNFTAKAAVGFNWHPDYRYELRIMPTIYYNLASTSKATVLRENLFNVGLTAAVLFKLK